MSTHGQPVLRASEVGRYAYCARAWWLQRVMGCQPRNLEALQRGTQRHAQHGRGVQHARRQTGWAVALATVAVALLLAYVVLTLS